MDRLITERKDEYWWECLDDLISVRAAGTSWSNINNRDEAEVRLYCDNGNQDLQLFN